MLTNKVYYFFTFIGLSFGIFSILLCPHLVLPDAPDVPESPNTTIDVAKPRPKLVTESPIETMLEATFLAAVSLMNFRLPMLLVMADHAQYFQRFHQRVPCSLNAIVIFPKLMYKVMTCGRLVLSSLWMLNSSEHYRYMLQMAVLFVLQFYMMGQIYMVLHYTTEVRNQRRQLNEAAANGAAWNHN